jgi:integrase
LALLRSVFNFAKREGFITKTPFEMGAPLISAADETKRDRVLSRQEVEKLLLALSDERRLHIRALVVAALDSGARKNELLTLRWSDVDLLSGVITVRAFNTKTAKSRQVPISARLKDELERIRNESETSQNRNQNAKITRRHGSQRMYEVYSDSVRMDVFSQYKRIIDAQGLAPVQREAGYRAKEKPGL